MYQPIPLPTNIHVPAYRKFGLCLLIIGLVLTSACSRERYTELMSAARDGADKPVTRALDAGVDVNEQSSQGKTALMLAASNGHTGTVKLLIDHGAGVKLQDSFGTTALIVAATAGKTETTILLLKNGADPLHKDSSGGSALSNATYFGHTDTVQALLDNVGKLSRDDGEELMMLAAGLGHLDIAKALLAKGVSANAVGAKGHTALMAAIQFEKPEMVKLLLEHGADPGRKDDEGDSAQMLAEKKGNKVLLQLLQPATPAKQ